MATRKSSAPASVKNAPADTLETLAAQAVEACANTEGAKGGLYGVMHKAAEMSGNADAFDGWLETVREGLKSRKLSDGTLRNYASAIRKLLRGKATIPTSPFDAMQAAGKLDKDGNVKPEKSEAEKAQAKADKAKADEQSAQLSRVPLEGRLLLEKLNAGAIAVMLTDAALGVAALERAWQEIEAAGKALMNAAQEGNAPAARKAA